MSDFVAMAIELATAARADEVRAQAAINEARAVSEARQRQLSDRLFQPFEDRWPGVFEIGVEHGPDGRFPELLCGSSLFFRLEPGGGVRLCEREDNGETALYTAQEVEFESQVVVLGPEVAKWVAKALDPSDYDPDYVPPPPPVKKATKKVKKPSLASRVAPKRKR